MEFLSRLFHKQLPNNTVRAGLVPEKQQPFEQSLLDTANRILGLEASNQFSYRIRPCEGAAQFADVTLAASLVVTDISRVISHCEYEKHFLHPKVRPPEDAVSAACFIAACLLSIAEVLKDRNVPFDLQQAYSSRAGTALMQLYDPKDQLAILKSGSDLFRLLIDSIPEHPNLKEWLDAVRTLTLVCILTSDAHTREQVYMPALGELYLSIWQVWTERTLLTDPPPPAHQ